MPSIIATLITSGRECRVTMVASLLAGVRSGGGRSTFVSNERDHVYSGRTKPANQPARQGMDRARWDISKRRNKVYFESATATRSRTMPVNSITSAAATARASVQVRRSYRRAPALNIGSTDTDRSESFRDPEVGREGGYKQREAKQNEGRDENEGGSGRSARRIV